MALLRRARKDMSMAALVEAHRRHVQAEEEEGTGRHDPNGQGEDSEEEWPADAVTNEYDGRHHQPRRRHSYQDSDDDDDEEEEEEQKRENRYVGTRYNAHRHPAAPSALRISETDTVTCAGSDENITPDSQSREYDRYQQQQQRHGLYHYGPSRDKTRGKQLDVHDYEEPLQRSSARRAHTKQQSAASPLPYRPAAKVSSALMKPMQMMRDRSLAHRQARRNGTNSGRGGIAIIEGGGDEGNHYYAENERSHNGDHRHSQIDARSVAADGTGLVKVDEKMIRYIDETLVKPDDQVFNRYTRCFHDKSLEHLYQEYTAINWFSRARWHILLLLLVHLLVLLMFVIMPSSGFKSMDQFMLSVDAVPTWTQWLYLLVAVPFACLPSDKNPFQKRWRFWACLIVVVFNFAFQLWLAHAGQLALEHFDGIVHSKLQCNTNNTAYLFAKHNSTNGSGSSSWSESSSHGWDTIVVNGTTEELSPAALREMSKAQIQFVHAVTYLYAGALVQLLIGFAWLFSFIFAISIRLEFVYVMITGFSAVITYMFIVFLFSIQVEWMSTFSYGFAVMLLFILSRSADITNRRSFLSTFVVEKENESLKSSLNKAEAALMNEPAGDKERQVVEHVLDVPEMKALELFRIPFADLKFLQAIGRGAMGDVIKAKYLGTMVVCKRIRRENINETTIESFREEIVLMSCLRHPNIVQFIGASWDNYSNLCIVMEYLENGDMHSVLHSTIGKNFTWSDPLLKMAIDIVQGMLYLHSQDPPIVHRDLKSVNVLCSATYGCNVGDFGLSRRYKKGVVDALTTLVGTPFWLAPEIIRNDRYGPAADVYSFGIVLTELETRNTPYHELDENGIKVMMRIAHNNLRPSLPATCLPQRRKLITDCLLDNPASRPTFAEILARLQGAVQLEIEDDATKATLSLERRTLLKKTQ
ncbi:Tkl/drk protein kinase, partial [Globisporangium splendens]